MNDREVSSILIDAVVNGASPYLDKKFTVSTRVAMEKSITELIIKNFPGANFKVKYYGTDKDSEEGKLHFRITLGRSVMRVSLTPRGDLNCGFN